MCCFEMEKFFIKNKINNQMLHKRSIYNLKILKFSKNMKININHYQIL